VIISYCVLILIATFQPDWFGAGDPAVLTGVILIKAVELAIIMIVMRGVRTQKVHSSSSDKK
jgi:uncharacterized membrane protein (DUF485 family)